MIQPSCRLVSVWFVCVALSLASWCGSARAAETVPTSKLEVSDPDAARALEAKGGRLLATYESFQLWEAPAQVAAAALNQSGVRKREGDDVIELTAQAINTTDAVSRKAKAAISSFTGKRLHLVQFAGPVKPEWHAALGQLGLTVVTHVPRNAYLVYGDAKALQALRKLAGTAPHIQWEGEYLGEHKMDPPAQIAKQRAVQKQAAEDLFAVQLVADEPGNAGTLQWMDQNKLELVKRFRHLDYLNVVLRLPPDRLPDLASRPDVVSIQLYRVPKKRDERQGQILAGNLSGNGPSGPGYLAWLQGKGFTAAQFAVSGFAVDVTDSGIDNGTQTPGHPGLYVLGNAASSSRVVYNRLLGSPNGGSTIQACDGHGNINSHIIGGYNDLTGFPHMDSAGYRYGLGIAPFVRVGSSVIFDPDSFTFPDYFELQSRAYNDGARISCNSWGADVGGSYNIDCQQYDSLVRDAQQTGSPFPTPGNQEMVIVFAAGNAGSSFGSVGAPGGAKNIISVGAAENVHSHSSANGGGDSAGSDGCGLTDINADNANDIVYFSSRGPCLDGRIKPDLVGPGTHVTGGVGQQSNPGANGTALSCFVASGVCALNSGGFFPVGQQFYTTSSGTSHSCPAVGGGAALLRQYFINHFWPIPSPAMTKAWLMSSARYMNGVGANDTLPSNNQGMGSMNLGMALDDAPRIRRDQLALDRFTASGQTRVFNGFVADPTRPLRITLAFTDAPGSTVGNAYNNDLDLTVVFNGQTYHGNVFAGSTSIPGGLADPRNNVESVFLPAGLSGPFTITVSAANINSDGVPGNADALDQDFALVVYNSSDRPVLLVSAGSAFTAESCVVPNSAPDPGETVTVDLTLRNVGPSNSTAVVATLLPTGGVTAPSAPQTYGVIAANGGTATRAFTFTASGACGTAVTATLQLQDGTNDLGLVTFAWPMGTLRTNSAAFGDSASVTISPVNGAVAPYPSVLNVSGVVGAISQLFVSINSLNHSWPEDLDLVLVGPEGQSVVLMSDVGGFFDVTNVFLYFDDLAASGLPQDTPLQSGTWRPTDFELDGPFPPPAPAGPYGSALSVFKGTNPNGAWRLFVVDDYASDDGGELVNGWSLSFLTTNRVCCLDPAAVDLALTQHDSPDPVGVSNIVTYALTVTNRGPGTAPGVTLTNSYSVQGEFLSAVVSRGSFVQAAGVVTWDLGTLLPGEGASIQTQVRAIGGPEITSSATVTSAALDYDQGNNQDITTTTVSVPALSIIGTTIVEGDSGTRDAVVLVALSHTSPQTIAVSYRTAAGTASSGLDFITQSNRLEFAPGEVVKTFLVPVLGDVLDEDDETFLVELLDPSNAGLQVPQAACTIVDDDAMPTLSVSDAVVVEGDGGTTNAIFIVGVSPASGRPVRLTFTTSDATARSGSDYTALALNVTIEAGSVSTGVLVSVTGDTLIESDETFLVQLSSPTNAVIGDGAAVGTIVSDDLAPIISVAGYRVLAENLLPLNGSIDPGETVTVSLALLNIGSAPTTNLVGTLLTGNGVQSPSSAQTYGVLPPGGQVSRSFTFTMAATNCGSIIALVQAQDGPVNLGDLPFPVAVGGDVEFIIHGFSASGSQVVDHNSLTSDDRGGVAVSSSQAFVTGDSATARFNVTNLSGGVSLGLSYDGLVSDLRTETVYLLGFGDTPIVGDGNTVIVNSLLPLDGNTGLRSGDRIDLSTNIFMEDSSGVFAGYGRIVLHNGTRVFDINPLTGQVVDLGAMLPPLHTFSESWAYWGVAEYFGGFIHLVYVQSSTSIARARVPDGAVTTLATFSSLGDMASITVSPKLGRWYFHYEGSAQFGGSSETLGYADAAMSVVCGNSAPLIITQPQSQTAFENGAAIFQAVVVGGKPMSYQWRFQGSNLSGATTATLTLTNVSPDDAGAYSVVVANSYGSITSSVALLTVLSAGSGFLDDFDPDIDLIQWSGFGGTVGTTVIANGFGGFISAPNSLWFGGDTIRSATSRLLNTSGGGTIGFDLRLGSGSYPWEQADLPGEGIAFSYSVNGGSSWTEIGRYDNTTYYDWTHISMSIPPGAQAPSVLFRWQQLSHSGADFDHWALDNAFVNSGPAAPTITSQPVGRTVPIGGTATFEVTAQGTAPLFYQWRFNGVNRSGATNSALTISGVASNDVGQYSVLVSNAYGSVTSAVAHLNLTISGSGPVSALLIWDVVNSQTTALIGALEAAGITVTLSATSEISYNGNNPSPTNFQAVIHLNGTTYGTAMPLAGQNALVNYVQGGGGYLHSEWNAYELGNGTMTAMRDLILFDRIDGFEGTLTYTAVAGQTGHPVIANVPSTFSFQAGGSRCQAHVFATQPATVLMQDSNSAPAVMVREFGAGRVVGFNHAGNYDNNSVNNTLANPNVQQLFIDGVRWAAALPIPPAGPTVFINFEDGLAPASFSATNRLTGRYAALGVTFEGPGGNDGGAVVSTNGNWFVTGHSATNFLAFNTAAILQDGGVPRGPETIRFSPLATHVGLKIAAGSFSVGSSATLTAYGPASNVVATATVLLGSACTNLQVAGSAIARVVLSSTADAFIVDDVSVTFVNGGALAFLPPTAGTNQIYLRFTTLPGQTYTIRYKDSLDDLSWQILQSVLGDGTIRTVPTSVTGAMQRFYRLTIP